MSEFVKLFEPGKIGKLGVKNRIIMAPMGTDFPDEEGKITDQQIDYYAERARGGVGLIVVEGSYPRLGGHRQRVCIYDDRFVPGLRRLAAAIHEGGAKVACQVNPHRGRADLDDPASPSGIPHPFQKEGIKPRVITVADLKKLEEEFREGIRRVKEAGFDGVMIHGASGYLVHEFLSPKINKRTDEYGGDLKGRARFALELVMVTREEVGPDYPVIFRLAADERVKGGLGVEESIAFCKMLQDRSVDLVDITSGGQEGIEWRVPTMYQPPACNADISEAIKKELRIPVSVVGKINDPYLAEEILREGKADFVCLGRALIADPQFPKKAMEGEVRDIRRCIVCQRCSEAIRDERGPLYCTINPAVGREREFEIRLKPVKKGKRVLIIGGGPAGMEAAIIAAQRGHNVTLWEASDKLGGQLNLAVIPPGKSDFDSLLEYFKIQLEKLKVIVEFGKEATIAAIEEFAPDAVIVAVGSTEFVPDILGINNENVISAREVLSGEKEAGNEVVVIGGGTTACELGDFLAEKGKNVVLAFPEAAPMSIGAVERSIRKVLLERLKEKKVKILAGVKRFSEITQKGISLVDKEGQEVFLEADNIVLAAGARPNKTLAQSLKGKFSKVYEVGDCVEARRLKEAIHEGAEAALEI